MTLMQNADVTEDPNTGKPWSDREIARRCHVANSFVSKIRHEVTVFENSEQPTARTYTTRPARRPLGAFGRWERKARAWRAQRAFLRWYPVWWDRFKNASILLFLFV